MLARRSLRSLRKKENQKAGKAAIRPMDGDFLVEAVVAVLVSGIIGTAMIQMYGQVHKVGNESQGQLVAAAIAQEVIDQLRAQPFANIAANAGLHQPQVNGTGNGDILFPRGLLQDTSPYLGPGNTANTLSYTQNGLAGSPISQGANNLIHTVDPVSGAPSNTINVNIVLAPGGSAYQVTVTIAWLDGSSGKQRTYQTQSLITQYGING